MREDRKPAGPRAIGELMAEVIKSQAGPRRRELLELSEAWARAAGPEVARWSRPLSLGKGGQLTVRFESSTLRHEVQSYRKAEILARLQTQYPSRRIAVLKCVMGQ